ncbi:hypothetical protein HYV82_04295 [Candidatus Woesearchaeota archaeon]|nr:hypothetical protein [Candidatus Woesearchaeota archaeon]
MQQPMPHQLMGYDRAITMFSPDGRLLQVEYAKKTVKQGSTAIGIVCKEGVVLVTDKRIVDSLVVPEAVEKIYQIDDHIGATASGILSDARVLDMALQDALKLGIRALYRILDKELSVERVDCAFIKSPDNRFTRLQKSEVEKLIDEVKGKARKKE